MAAIRRGALSGFAESGVAESGLIELGAGRRVALRPLRVEDCRRLDDFYASLAPRSCLLRFSVLAVPAGAAASACERVASGSGIPSLVAVSSPAPEEIVAEALTARLRVGVAEIALAVRNDYCSLGLGGVMLDALVTQARRTGLHTLVGMVSAENTRMLALLRARHAVALESQSWSERTLAMSTAA